MDEQWSKWEPIQGLAPHYYIDSISDSYDAFLIGLTNAENENKKIEIKFRNSVEAYRSTYETYRHYLLEILDKTYGMEFFTKWSFFKVKNSDYIKWLSEQSCGIWDSKTITHFSIMGGESIVDVIANYDPIVVLKQT
ncbi:MAG: hypothetical protein JEZ00_05375 [Anaerolineaceae bacterium]|nr:hypothetical protein [Anaerolineaceae bacterium]